MIASPHPSEFLAPQTLNPTTLQPPKTAKVLRHPTAQQGDAAVVVFPPTTKWPLWLRILFFVQHGSSLLTFCFATAVLIAYGSTVYIQQEWSEDYHHLEQLQREKRELVAANELMKNQLAQQASTADAGLMTPSPANTIFLPKASGRSFAPVPATTLPLVDATAKMPLGY